MFNISRHQSIAERLLCRNLYIFWKFKHNSGDFFASLCTHVAVYSIYTATDTRHSDDSVRTPPVSPRSRIASPQTCSSAASCPRRRWPMLPLGLPHVHITLCRKVASPKMFGQLEGNILGKQHFKYLLSIYLNIWNYPQNWSILGQELGCWSTLN